MHGLTSEKSTNLPRPVDLSTASSCLFVLIFKWFFLIHMGFWCNSARVALLEGDVSKKKCESVRNSQNPDHTIRRFQTRGTFHSS